MKMISVANRAEIMVSICALIVFLAVILCGVRFIFQYQHYSRGVADLQPKIARLVGLIESEEILEQLEQEITLELSDLVYTGALDENSVGTQMQQSMRTLFSDAGMNVTGSQIVLRKSGSEFVRAGVNVSVTGSLDALVGALVQLEQRSPVVVVRKVEITPIRRAARRRSKIKPLQMINVKIQLVSFKLES